MTQVRIFGRKNSTSVSFICQNYNTLYCIYQCDYSHVKIHFLESIFFLCIVNVKNVFSLNQITGY